MADDTSERPTRRAFIGGLAAVAATTGTVGATAAEAHGTSSKSGVATQSAQQARLQAALRVRHEAAELSAAIPLPVHTANGDVRSDNSFALAFTKGLAHDYETGLVDRAADFEKFVQACETGDRQQFRALALGPRSGFRTAASDAPLRAWETQTAGLCFNLVGHDPQSLTLPPAPQAGSAELTAELAEIYAQALLRDEPLTTFRVDAYTNTTRDGLLNDLSALPWFSRTHRMVGLSAEGLARRRAQPTPQTAFRGIAPGDTVGPYVSQLLLAGSSSATRKPYEGIIDYGAQTINQRVRQVGRTNFMTSWDEWFDIQNALSPVSVEPDTGNRRFITTGRDLATYVHSDALYQPYLNACLVLLTNDVPLDPSLPYQQDDRRDHQQGFVLYAIPHVLSMLVEVCGRALKTVAFQKFNVHQRLRPEALAARVHKADVLDLPEIERMASQLDGSGITEGIRRATSAASGAESLLLPMAFVEGSPMHPSYGAGHATVAGACVTILKALFDHTRPFGITGDASTAFVATTDGSRLATVDVYDASGAEATLTVEGELNKLAANIAIGRNWAGVHYFSDYWESLLLGEQIAIEILREHMLTVPEAFNLRVPLFDGSRVWL